MNEFISKNSNNEWWGYSTTQGWVILFKTFFGNENSTSTTYNLIRCRDWVLVEEEKIHLKPPNYIYVINFLTLAEKQVSINAQKELKKLLLVSSNKVKELVREFQDQVQLREKSKSLELEEARNRIPIKTKEELAILQANLLARVEKLHNSFLLANQLEKAGIYKSNGLQRSKWCWNCGVSVSNKYHFSCMRCNWFICNLCGACKKPYPHCGIGLKPKIKNNPPKKEIKKVADNTNQNKTELNQPKIFDNFNSAANYAKQNSSLKIRRTENDNEWEVK